MKTKVSEYKGKPVLQILETLETTNVDTKEKTTKDSVVITFGLRKARAILTSMDDIQTFVDSNTSTTSSTAPIKTK